MRPRPTTPTVFSKSSVPVYFERFHAPPLSAWLAWGTCRAVASSRATASSAAETMLDVGALTTMTPCWVAALTSTLSRPTPARATTLSFLAACSASTSTWVADRTRIASASAIAASSSARSAPLQWRISKSGPSASRVAGLSSSAMSTTGFVTGGSSTVVGAAFAGVPHVRCGSGAGGDRARRCAGRPPYPLHRRRLGDRRPDVGQARLDGEAAGEQRAVVVGVLADQGRAVAAVEVLVAEPRRQRTGRGELLLRPDLPDAGP